MVAGFLLTATAASVHGSETTHAVARNREEVEQEAGRHSAPRDPSGFFVAALVMPLK